MCNIELARLSVPSVLCAVPWHGMGVRKTNWNFLYMYTESALEDLGALQHLDPVLVSEKEGIEKPSRNIFIRACERAGVEPRNAIHVGDELVWYVPSFSFPFNPFHTFWSGSYEY